MTCNELIENSALVVHTMCSRVYTLVPTQPYLYVGNLLHLMKRIMSFMLQSTDILFLSFSYDSISK